MGRRRLLVAVTSAVAVLLVGWGLGMLVARGWAHVSDPGGLRHTLVFSLAALLVIARALTIRTERSTWIAFAIGLVLNAVAEILWLYRYAGALSSPADIVFAAAYLSYFVAFALYLRHRVGGAYATLSFDTLGVTVYVSAIAAALAVPAIRAHAGVSTLSATSSVVYVAADLALAWVILAVASMSGTRMRRQDTLLVLSFVTMLVGDCVYGLGLTGAIPELHGLEDVAWETSPLLMGLAAWSRPTAPGALRLGGWWEVVPTLTLVLAGGAVLVAAAFTPVEPIAVGLAAAALVAAMVRVVRITRDVRALVEHRRDALTDELTGLPNRRALLEGLDLLTRHGAQSGERAALLVIDLDGFKELNATLGPKAGDALLVDVARRLVGLAPGSLARVAGDEFAALVVDGVEPHDVARAIAAGLEAPMEVDGVTLSLQSSIGIARFPQDAETAGALLSRAHVAMVEARRMRLGVCAYSPDHDRYARDRLALAGELRDALAAPDGGGLWLAFQPQAEIPSGHVIGGEALIRWDHPTRGAIQPGQLLPVAERLGLMAPLTDWVLDRAVGAAAAWDPELSVSVNVSAATLIDAGLPARVADVLGRHGVSPERLTIEVTEDAVMADPRRCGEVLAALVAIGVEIATDDFGTGQSSMMQLKRIPAHELKLDRSFVLGMSDDRVDLAVVHAAIDLGRRLDMRVVGEGIEDVEAWTALNLLGCDVGQGYAIARPMPVGDFVAFVQASRLAGAEATPVRESARHVAA